MDQKRISLSVSDERSQPDLSLGDLIMAWAVDATTHHPRYILELDAAHNGDNCNCACPSCNLPLTAINAGRLTWKRRPHFRHPKGAERNKCLIIAARKAIETMFGRQERIVLPRRCRSREVEGLSGAYHDAWVERPAETVGIARCDFSDGVNAFLTLDDGRRLHVRLLGRGEIVKEPEKDRLTACIEIHADDPAVANMSPAEILTRLELVWTEGCWIQHWSDDELDAEADELARAKAAEALDWLDADDLPDDLSSVERRETLLHREVKAILERERRIRVPKLEVESAWRCANGFVDKRAWSFPDANLRLSSVELEVHLGRSVPDVVATWIEETGTKRSMLIEVTVTNRITDERIERLSSFGWPALEIDISRMGGMVTRDELTRLVIDEVAGKRWLYHPTLDEENARLITAMKQEEAQAVEVERQKQALLSLPDTEWGIRYLNALRRRWLLQLSFGEGLPDSEPWRQAQADIAEAILGLAAHGYPASLLDEYPLRTVITRILSFRDGTGIEYRTDVCGVINDILRDELLAKKWHTIYLIALKVYPPALTGAQQNAIEVWRGQVIASVRPRIGDAMQTTYVRESAYDRLIGLLFPEMRHALESPFGTAADIPERERGNSTIACQYFNCVIVRRCRLR